MCAVTIQVVSSGDVVGSNSIVTSVCETGTTTSLVEQFDDTTNIALDKQL